MKNLYNEKKRLMKELNKVGYLLDKKIEERFGFSYSQTDTDPIKHTLGYGNQDLEYKEFLALMEG